MSFVLVLSSSSPLLLPQPAGAAQALLTGQKPVYLAGVNTRS